MGTIHLQYLDKEALLYLIESYEEYFHANENPVSIEEYMNYTFLEDLQKEGLLLAELNEGGYTIKRIFERS